MSISQELERLAKLHADGALSDEEFTKAKSQLLAAPGLSRVLFRAYAVSPHIHISDVLRAMQQSSPAISECFRDAMICFGFMKQIVDPFDFARDRLLRKLVPASGS